MEEMDIHDGEFLIQLGNMDLCYEWIFVQLAAVWQSSWL